MPDKLEKYLSKRNFDRSKEPKGGSKKKSLRPIFVVQKHNARNLHYDFRLEIDGVLASWAVLKGPSLNPSDKRLAMPTEDHPLEYAEFEGTIPEDEYGGGQVIVWDAGEYRRLKEESMEKMLGSGKIEIELMGEKLKGGFTLIRMSGRDQWLLIKMKDEQASEEDILNNRPESVLSGKKVEDFE